MSSKKRKNTKTAIFLLVLVVIFLLISIGFGVSLVFSSYQENHEHEVMVNEEVNSFQEFVQVRKKEISEPEEPEETQPRAYQELWDAMQAYNQRIYESDQAELVDAWVYEEGIFDLTTYGYDINAFGLVTIPDINVEMPLFLGASYDNLAKGFAQLSQTSMPTGGNNTNCVIAGHRGWRGMAYMRDVEMLEIGDSVFVENPWETLEYRIDKILLINPWEIESIFIQDNRDLLTIITCHPYGVGSHRYVLICERYITEEPAEAPVIADKIVWEWVDRVEISTSRNDMVFESSQVTIFVEVYLPWIILGTAIVLMLIALIILIITILKNRSPGKYQARNKN